MKHGKLEVVVDVVLQKLLRRDHEVVVPSAPALDDSQNVVGKLLVLSTLAALQKLWRYQQMSRFCSVVSHSAGLYFLEVTLDIRPLRNLLDPDFHPWLTSSQHLC